MKLVVCITLVALVSSGVLSAQEGGLPPVQKVRNYLPHMTVPEVQDLLARSDMVIIPVASLEQHGLHLPIGTDYLNGVERAKLIAQRVDVLVAPILLPGQSPYHMGFEGTVRGARPEGIDSGAWPGCDRVNGHCGGRIHSALERVASARDRRPLGLTAVIAVSLGSPEHDCGECVLRSPHRRGTSHD